MNKITNCSNDIDPNPFHFIRNTQIIQFSKMVMDFARIFNHEFFGTSVNTNFS